MHDSLQQRHNKLIEWSHLRVVNRSLNLGLSPAKMIDYLKDLGVPQDSAVLSEKLADLYASEGKDLDAIEADRSALELSPTPQQKVRLTMTLGERLAALWVTEEAR